MNFTTLSGQLRRDTTPPPAPAVQLSSQVKCHGAPGSYESALESKETNCRLAAPIKLVWRRQRRKHRAAKWLLGSWQGEIVRKCKRWSYAIYLYPRLKIDILLHRDLKSFCAGKLLVSRCICGRARVWVRLQYPPLSAN